MLFHKVVKFLVHSLKQGVSSAFVYITKAKLLLSGDQLLTFMVCWLPLKVVVPASSLPTGLMLWTIMSLSVGCVKVPGWKLIQMIQFPFERPVGCLKAGGRIVDETLVRAINSNSHELRSPDFCGGCHRTRLGHGKFHPVEYRGSQRVRGTRRRCETDECIGHKAEIERAGVPPHFAVEGFVAGEFVTAPQ